MHEFSIAEQIMPPLLESAMKHGATRIVSVHLLLGENMLIVPHALEQALNALSADTIAEGAEWRFTEEKTEMRCNKCSASFHPEMGNYICPACGEADAEIIAGKDILIDSIDCDIEGETDENKGS